MSALKSLLENSPSNLQTEALAELAELDRMLIRARRELLSILADINAEQIPHDGDDFHELLRDLDRAITR